MKSVLNSLLIVSCSFLFLFSCSKEDDNNDCGCDEKYGSFIDGRDGHEYKTIKIGEQTWMAENLAYLPEVSDYTVLSEIFATFKVYGYYGNNLSEAKANKNYQMYGVLYNWPAAMNSCPNGWHLPNDKEWTIMEEYLIANGYNYDSTITGNKIAKALASACEWEEDQNEGSIGNSIYQNNRSCFSALPGGMWGIGSEFSRSGNHGYWWSCSVSDEGIPVDRVLRSYFEYLSSNDMDKDCGISVRCIKNE